MRQLSERLQTLWQPPRQASEDRSGRRVTFLELFYDLVYVVIIAQLSHDLSRHVSWAAVGQFAFLFVIVWWAWINGTSYHDVHGNDDFRTRVFTFLQMFAVVAMAVFAHDALGANSVGFPLAFAAFQLILTFMWWRTGVHDPKHRVLSGPYSAGFFTNTLLFIASIFVQPPVRFYLWAVALLISLALPAVMLFFGRRSPEGRAEIEVISRFSPALVERFGLFTIIVLGEVIVGTVAGISEQSPVTAFSFKAGLLSTGLAIGIWWLYFDFVSERIPSAGIFLAAVWLYLHLPMTMAITGLGAAVLNLIQHSGEPLAAELRWLLVGSLFLILLSIAFLMLVTRRSAGEHDLHPAAIKATLIAAFLVLSLGFAQIAALALLAAVVVLFAMPIVYTLISVSDPT